MPVGFGFTVTDDCDPSPTKTLSVYSTEPDGAAPFAPDVLFIPPTALRLRAERAFPGPGRVYIVVMNAVDADGNRGAECRSLIVPVFPTLRNIMSLRLTAALGVAACQASSTDVAPPGYVPLVMGAPIP